MHQGDEIKLYISDDFLKPKPLKTDTVYEDENILALFKPKGIEVTGENSIESFFRNSIFPCHRLDRNTSRSCTIC